MPAAVVALAILGAAHILLRTSTFGSALTTDSLTYLDIALSAIAGSPWVSAEQPPLFSFLLAGAGWVSGGEPVELARWINAMAFGATIFCCGLWLCRALRSRLLAIGATAAIAASLPLTAVASHVWTEPVFILLVVVTLVALDAATRTPIGSAIRRTCLVVACVATMLATTTRYPGVTLVFAGTLVLLLDARPNVARRLGNAFTYGLASSSALAALLIYNWAISGDATGQRPYATGKGIHETLLPMTRALHEWLADPFADTPWWAACLTIAGCAVLAGAICPLAQRTAGISRTNQDESVLPQRWCTRSFDVFIVVYLLFLVMTVPFFSGQDVDSRYLSPIYAPAIMALALFLERLAHTEHTRLCASRTVAVNLLLGGSVAHTAFCVAEGLDQTRTAIREGVGGYNTRHWQESQIVSYFRKEGPLLSEVVPLHMIAANNHAVLPVLLHRTYTRDGRDLWADRRTLPNGGVEEFTRWLAARPNGSYVVWFHHIGFWSNAYFHYDIVDLRCTPGLRKVMDTVQGTVFRVDRGYEPRCTSVSGLPAPGTLLSHSTFSVYVDDRFLYLQKTPCTARDTAASFFLHVVPASKADLSAWRRLFGFDNLDSVVGRSMVFRNRGCRAAVPLPEYPWTAFRTGQSDPTLGKLWSVEHP